MYSAYTLSEETRRSLLESHKPLFPDVICEHITFVFPVKKGSDLPPQPKSIRIVGYNASRSMGVECFVVEIDGNIKRSDGSLYHITISIDRSKGARPAQSNELLRRQGFNQMYAPIDIEVTPAIL